MQCPIVAGRPQPAACCTLASPATHRICFLPPACLENGPPSHGLATEELTKRPGPARQQRAAGHIRLVNNRTVLQGYQGHQFGVGPLRQFVYRRFIHHRIIVHVDRLLYPRRFVSLLGPAIPTGLRADCSVCILCAGRLDRGSAEDPHQKRTL